MSNININQLGFNALNDCARQAIFDLVYPVGCYIHTDSPDFNTVEKVETYYGGHWEKVENGRFLEAGSTPDTHEPGLPNITGSCTGYTWNTGYGSGAFSSYSTHDATVGGSEQHKNYVDYHFDAAKCSPIYGRSTTVQPKSQVVYIYHRLPVQNS